MGVEWEDAELYTSDRRGIVQGAGVVGSAKWAVLGVLILSG